MRKGENYIPKNVLPESRLFDKEMDDLMDSVQGAVKARLQLGYEEIANVQHVLKPIIVDLKDKLYNLPKPLMVSQAPSSV